MLAAPQPSSATVASDAPRAASTVTPYPGVVVVTSTPPAVSTVNSPPGAVPNPAGVNTAVRTVVPEPARSYLSSAADVSVTMADFCSLTRLAADNKEDMLEVLTHVRVMGIKAGAVSQDTVFVDNVALKHVALVGSGEALTLVLHILSGQIDCVKAADTSDPETTGSHPPSRTWQETVDTLLHFLLTANSIEEGAAQIAAIQQRPYETVSSYALRFRTILSRFLAAVKRAERNRTP